MPLRIAIAVDRWKLPIFKEALDKAGFTHKQTAGITKNTATLTVETDDVRTLTAVVKIATVKAAKSKKQH